MNVKEVVSQYLKAIGADGLYSEYGECGCDLANLMCCDNAGIDLCEPAKKFTCASCGEDTFIPVRGIREACRKLDEKQKSEWREVSGIFADERPRASTHEAG